MKRILFYCIPVCLLLSCCAKSKLYLKKSDPLLGTCWTFIGFIRPNGEIDCFPADYNFKIGFDPRFKIWGAAIYPDYRGSYRYKGEKIFISASSTIGHSSDLDTLSGGGGYALTFIRRYNAVLSSSKSVKFAIDGDELLIYTESGQLMKFQRDNPK